MLPYRKTSNLWDHLILGHTEGLFFSLAVISNQLLRKMDDFLFLQHHL